MREKIEKDKEFAKKCYSVLEDLIGYVKSLENLKILEITGDDATNDSDFERVKWVKVWNPWNRMFRTMSIFSIKPVPLFFCLIISIIHFYSYITKNWRK